MIDRKRVLKFEKLFREQWRLWDMGLYETSFIMHCDMEEIAQRINKEKILNDAELRYRAVILAGIDFS